MKYSLNILLLITPLIITGCFSEGGGVGFTSLVDHAKTKIVVLGEGIANGTTFLYFEIHSINSNNSINKNFTPDVTVTSAVKRGCDPTNSEGIARCAITSLTPGIKTISLINELVDTSAPAIFNTPLYSNTVIEKVTAATSTILPSGHIINSSLTNYNSPIHTVLPSGHNVYTKVQGIIIKSLNY